MIYTNYPDYYGMNGELPGNLTRFEFGCTWLDRTYKSKDKTFYIEEEIIKLTDRVEIMREGDEKGVPTGRFIHIYRSELLAKIATGALKEIPPLRFYIHENRKPNYRR